MTRWQRADVARGDDYDERWRTLAAEGANIHGEADLVAALLTETAGRSVLDAGCGTGRVAIELACRGYTVTGVDVDAEMLATAKRKAPELSWRHADLADPKSRLGTFDVVLLAGNVMIFVEPGTERTVLTNCADRLVPGGLLVAGFSLRPDGLSLAEYDAMAEAAGLRQHSRWATWDQAPYAGGDYAVSVHQAVSVRRR